METFFLYASIVLAPLGVAALALFVLFRLRLNRLNRLSKNSVANTFNRTFVVFEPYSKKRIFHSFLSLLPPVPFICGLALAALFLAIISSGFLVMFLGSIVGLGLIAVEELSEAYTTSKIFIHAMQSGSGLGVGDMRLIQITKKLLARLSYYYLGVSIFLVGLAVALPYVWSHILWLFAAFIGLMFQVGPMAGPERAIWLPLGWTAAIFLYSLEITVFMTLVTKAKRLLFGVTPSEELSERYLE